MAEVLLAVLVFLPVVLSILLKSNAAISFLALCAGFAAISLSGSDIEQLVGKTKITSLTSNDLDLILLLVPLLVTLLVTFHTIQSSKKRLLHIIPALCAGSLLAVLAAPMLSDVININISDSAAWKQMHDFESYIMGVGLLVSLLLIWSVALLPPQQHPKKKHK